MMRITPATVFALASLVFVAATRSRCVRLRASPWLLFSLSGGEQPQVLHTYGSVSRVAVHSQ